jgi:hypothetical protein
VARWVCARRDDLRVKEVAEVELERFGEQDQHADPEGQGPSLDGTAVGRFGLEPLSEPALRPAEVFASPADARAKGG